MGENKQLKVGIVGCGRVASHFSSLIDKIKEARVIAFCDLVEERASLLAKQLKTAYYTNYHEMITCHPEIDIIYVATPSGMHFEHMKDIIARYKKDIIVEKPMVMTLDEGREIKELADRCGVQIFPIFQNRFNKAVERVKRAIIDNELGEIVLTSVRIWWYRPQKYYDRDPWRGKFSMDGGAMTNQGVHFIDLNRYLAGEVEKVNCVLATKGVKIEVENIAVALLKFKNRGLGTIEITTAAYPKDFEASLSIVGTKGTAVIGGIATNKLLMFSPDLSQEALCSEEFPMIYGFGHLAVFREIIDYLNNKSSKMPISFDDALETIRLLHALYRSDEVGGWVKLDEDCTSKRLGVRDNRLAGLYRTPEF